MQLTHFCIVSELAFFVHAERAFLDGLQLILDLAVAYHEAIFSVCVFIFSFSKLFLHSFQIALSNFKSCDVLVPLVVKFPPFSLGNAVFFDLTARLPLAFRFGFPVLLKGLVVGTL